MNEYDRERVFICQLFQTMSHLLRNHDHAIRRHVDQTQFAK